MAARRQKRTVLGAIFDDPREIMKRANVELEAARDLLAQRQAAEKAHLALSSSVEVAVRRALLSHSDELKGIDTVAKRAKDPVLAKDYKDLRRLLHGKCFHQGECGTSAELSRTFGKAEAMMDRILRTQTPRKK